MRRAKRRFGASSRWRAGGRCRVGEQGRRRSGRELHDEAGQSLLLLRLQLEMLERTATARVAKGLAEARGTVERVVTELRRIVAALSPAGLERLGRGGGDPANARGVGEGGRGWGGAESGGAGAAGAGGGDPANDRAVREGVRGSHGGAGTGKDGGRASGVP